jgi:hypothetical protein
MNTVKLNKANNFRANITVANDNTDITFLVGGVTADCTLYSLPGPVLVGTKADITAGNVAKFHVNHGNFQVQINPKGDTSIANATVSYD